MILVTGCERGRCCGPFVLDNNAEEAARLPGEDVRVQRSTEEGQVLEIDDENEEKWKWQSDRGR